MEETQRWGFIYCPKQGITRTHKRWERIQAALAKYHVDYDFVQSDARGSVVRLASMLARSGYRTIVVVGGDAALGQALNGIISAGENIYKEIALGVIPGGRGNDYASFWGLEENHEEESVRALVERRIRRVDLGLLRVLHNESQEELERHYFLGSVNIGLVAHIMNLHYKTFRFWGLSTMSYATSFLALLFHRMETRIKLRINHETIDRSIMTVAIGLSRNYGLTPSAVPYNGMMDVSLVSQPEALKLISGMWMLLSGRFLGSKSVSPYRTRMPIRIFSRHKAKVAVDGHVVALPEALLEITVKQECVNFIIPSI